jgi:hypothetical protein
LKMSMQLDQVKPKIMQETYGSNSQDSADVHGAFDAT